MLRIITKSLWTHVFRTCCETCSLAHAVSSSSVVHREQSNSPPKQRAWQPIRLPVAGAEIRASITQVALSHRSLVVAWSGSVWAHTRKIRSSPLRGNLSK
jgi:hypothetical protein